MKLQRLFLVVVVGLCGLVILISQRSVSASKGDTQSTLTPLASKSPIPSNEAGTKPCESCGNDEFVSVEDQVWSCPIFPIFSDPWGTLYYCDRYETEDCSDNPQADFIYGDYDWPYAGCGYPHCLGEVFNLEELNVPFNGLRDFVPEDYLHRWDESNRSLPGQVIGETRIPGGPARRSCRVADDYNDHFLSVRVGDEEIHAKILQFQFSRSIATGKTTGDNPSKTQDMNSYYIAFEMKDSSGVPVTGDNVVDLGPHAFHCNAEVSPGKSQRILVLLKNRE